jgi:hypothetical protein
LLAALPIVTLSTESTIIRFRFSSRNLYLCPLLYLALLKPMLKLPWKRS